MSFDGFDRPGPLKAQMEEVHRRERELEARAQLHAQLHADDGDSTQSSPGVRHALRRAWEAMRGR